jgi:hypothetical protein
MCYPNFKDVEISFVGSIAALLGDELQSACDRRGLRLGQIIRRPIDALANYHLEQTKINK